MGHNLKNAREIAFHRTNTRGKRKIINEK